MSWKIVFTSNKKYMFISQQVIIYIKLTTLVSTIPFLFVSSPINIPLIPKGVFKMPFIWLGYVFLSGLWNGKFLNWFNFQLYNKLMNGYLD